MEKLFKQWNTMLEYGTIPLFELKCINSKGEDDYYVFNINMHPHGLTFDIPDTDIKTWFSGDIVKLNECVFLLPFDEYFDDLDSYLEQIYQEISEGYLMPNRIHEVE